METGIIRRWQRFTNVAHGNSLIVPLDHGFTMGPIEGISSFSEVDDWLRNPAIDGVIVHKGLMKHLVVNKVIKHTAVCLHINGTSTLSSDVSEKPLLLDAEMAVRYGADAISLDLIFSPENTARNFALLGTIVRQANHYGMPILVMLSLKEGTYDPANLVNLQRQYIRSLCELGVTTVKLKRSESTELMHNLLCGICQDINIVFAGGAYCNEQTIIDMTAAAIDAGAKGICVGRNIFQHPRPEELLRKLKIALFGSTAKLQISQREQNNEFSGQPVL